MGFSPRRPVGEATAFPAGERPAETAPDPDPTRPWAAEATPRGSRDFRATKRYVRRARLTDGSGRGVAVRARGDRHVRAAVRDDGVDLLVLERSLAGGGGEWFDRNAALGLDATVAAGERLTGSVDVRLLDGDG